MVTLSRSQRSVQVVAFVEACKGFVVVIAATGLLALVHEDLNTFAARLVRHAHLNPASKYPHIFLDAVSHVGPRNVFWLALGAAMYSTARFVEAYGLFRNRAWAEWFAAASAAIYVPLEIIELVRRPTALGLVLLLVNLAIVAIMVAARLRRPHPSIATKPV